MFGQQQYVEQLKQYFHAEYNKALNHVLAQCTTMSEQYDTKNIFGSEEPKILNALINYLMQNNTITTNQISGEINNFTTFVLTNLKRYRENNMMQSNIGNNFLNNRNYSGDMHNVGLIGNAAMQRSTGYDYDTTEPRNIKNVLLSNTAPASSGKIDIINLDQSKVLVEKKLNPWAEKKVNFDGGQQYKDNCSNTLNRLKVHLSFKDIDDTLIKVNYIDDRHVYNDIFEAKKCIYKYNFYAIPNVKTFNLFSFREYIVISEGWKTHKPTLSKLMSSDLDNTYDQFISDLNMMPNNFVEIFKEHLLSSINSMIKLYGIVDNNFPKYVITMTSLNDLNEILTCTDGSYNKFMEHSKFMNTLKHVFKQAIKNLFDIKSGAKFFDNEVDTGHFIRCQNVHVRSNNGMYDKVDLGNPNLAEDIRKELLGKLDDVALLSKQRHVLWVNHLEPGFLQNETKWVVKENSLNIHYVINELLENKIIDLEIIFEIEGSIVHVFKVGKTLNGNLVFDKIN